MQPADDAEFAPGQWHYELLIERGSKLPAKDINGKSDTCGACGEERRASAFL